MSITEISYANDMIYLQSPIEYVMGDLVFFSFIKHSYQVFYGKRKNLTLLSFISFICTQSCITCITIFSSFC